MDAFLALQVLFPAHGALDFQGFQFFIPLPYLCQRFWIRQGFFHSDLFDRIRSWYVMCSCGWSYKQGGKDRAVCGGGVSDYAKGIQCTGPAGRF